MGLNKEGRIAILSFEEMEEFAGRIAEIDGTGPFVQPFWLKSWFLSFGERSKPLMAGIYEDSDLLGIAPLILSNGKASFMGNESVCDYQEMILLRDEEKFFYYLLDYLKEINCTSLELGALLPDSKSLQYLPGVCKKLGLSCVKQSAGSLFEMELPSTWDAYLTGLSTKQRHEIRRKMRRLREVGEVAFKMETENHSTETDISEFLAMFVESRADKAEFLNKKMKGYFKYLADGLAKNDFLRLGVLLLNDKPVSSVFCFEIADTLYLYNNGYKKEYSFLSVGSLSKIFSIKYAINKGCKRYSFLKGDEKYKKQLGGGPCRLSRLIIRF